MTVEVHRIKGLQPLSVGRHKVIGHIACGLYNLNVLQTVVLEIGENQHAKVIKTQVLGNRTVTEFEVSDKESV